MFTMAITVYKNEKKMLATNLQKQRIYHECEGRIEKSVPVITVCEHKACCYLMTLLDVHGKIAGVG